MRRLVIVPRLEPSIARRVTRPPVDDAAPESLALTLADLAVTRPPKIETPLTRALALALALPPRVEEWAEVPAPLSEPSPATLTNPRRWPLPSSRAYAAALAVAARPDD